MGVIKPPDRVKLFAGLLAPDEESFHNAEATITERWGKIDHRGPILPFTYTDYYAPEMGKTLMRRWVSFETLIEPSQLAGIKRYSNEVEDSFACSGKRVVNIDPGYLALSKIVLASTKDFSHRIYLSDGIYAEITLLYKQKQFVALPWSYPDYQSEPAIEFFKEIRLRYQEQLQNSTR